MRETVTAAPCTRALLVHSERKGATTPSESACSHHFGPGPKVWNFKHEFSQACCFLRHALFPQVDHAERDLREHLKPFDQTRCLAVPDGPLNLLLRDPVCNGKLLHPSDPVLLQEGLVELLQKKPTTNEPNIPGTPQEA